MLTLDTANALPPGYTLLEYRLDTLLGVGGFGLTYLAHDPNLNIPVAIKEYLPVDFGIRNEDLTVRARSQALQQSFDWGLKRFLEESRTLASFRHPNIVRVMRFFEANNTAYMVMEFVAGKALNECVKQRVMLNQPGLTRIAAPLLEGLELMHRAGCLHRDIKPQNIFIRDDGVPILIDFGSARMKIAADEELTAVVTPGFAPLEQYHRGGKQGPWTDIYALGGVLYWLVTGTKPHEAAARVREDKMPPAVEKGETEYYSAKFLAAIDWALKPQENDRPQSVAEWRVELIDNAALASARVNPPNAPTSRVHTDPPKYTRATVWDRVLLDSITTEFATYVGPIASLVVKKATKEQSNVQQLVQSLAEDIPDETKRSAFIRKFTKELSRPTSAEYYTQPPKSSSISELGVSDMTTSTLQRFRLETLQQAEAALAQYIGAVARVVVKRAAQKARDESELYLLLADEIEDKAEKRNFIRKAISVSGRV